VYTKRGSRLVFVNGILSENCRRSRRLPAGVSVIDIWRAFGRGSNETSLRESLLNAWLKAQRIHCAEHGFVFHGAFVFIAASFSHNGDPSPVHF